MKWANVKKPRLLGVKAPRGITADDTQCRPDEGGVSPGRSQGNPQITQITQIELPNPGGPHQLRARKFAASARISWVMVCFRDFVARFPLLHRDPQDAVGVGVRIPPKVPLEIAPRVGTRVAMRIGQRTGLAITARTRPQVTFRQGPVIEVQAGRRIAEKVHPPTPATAPVEIAP